MRPLYELAQVAAWSWVILRPCSVFVGVPAADHGCKEGAEAEGATGGRDDGDAEVGVSRFRRAASWNAEREEGLLSVSYIVQGLGNMYFIKSIKAMEV